METTQLRETTMTKKSVIRQYDPRLNTVLDTVSFTIEGRAATKKNNPQVSCRHNIPTVRPSKAFLAYEAIAVPKLREWWGDKPPIPGPVWVEAWWWMPDYAHWPDHNGLTTALGDILQKARIITDDKHIFSWDGCRIMGIDSADPRVTFAVRTLDGVGPWVKPEKERKRK